MNDMLRIHWTPTTIAAYMRGAANRRDWDNRCDFVKAAHGGEYPVGWFETVVASGMLWECEIAWGAQNV